MEFGDLIGFGFIFLIIYLVISVLIISGVNTQYPIIHRYILSDNYTAPQLNDDYVSNIVCNHFNAQGDNLSQKFKAENLILVFWYSLLLFTPPNSYSGSGEHYAYCINATEQFRVKVI